MFQKWNVQRVNLLRSDNCLRQEGLTFVATVGTNHLLIQRNDMTTPILSYSFKLPSYTANWPKVYSAEELVSLEMKALFERLIPKK
jgi:uracil phosphoribosyltransferase